MVEFGRRRELLPERNSVFVTRPCIAGARGLPDSPPRMADKRNIEALLREGLEALEADDVESAQEHLERARTTAGGEHAGVLHLSGMLAWAQGDYEQATHDLLAAVDRAPARPDIRLDCAECLFSIDELEEAEAQTRAVLELDDVSGEVHDEARLLLAQLRLADDDPEEALEVLDAVDPSRKEHAAFLSTRGTVLVADERFDEAIVDLKKALESEPTDPDLHYQLALALEQAGDITTSRESMVRVLELEVEEWQALHGDTVAPLEDVEAQELRSQLEDAMEELPEPILKLVASVPIHVQTRATTEQVRAGVNPRSIVGFLGTPKTDDAEADLQGLVIMRDLLLSTVEDEDEVEGELFYALAEEIQVFFQRTDLVLSEA